MHACISESGLSGKLIHPTLCREFSSLSCVQSNLVCATPGLSDTFYEEQMWSDKPGPTVHTFTCLGDNELLLVCCITVKYASEKFL